MNLWDLAVISIITLTITFAIGVATGYNKGKSSNEVLVSRCLEERLLEQKDCLSRARHLILENQILTKMVAKNREKEDDK